MALLWAKRTIMASLVVASIAVAGVVGAKVSLRKAMWSGEVKPGSGWLTRQGLAESYPIQFTMDAGGRSTGIFLFSGGINPAAGGQAALKGRRDADGAAYYLSATIEGGHGLPAAVRSQAEVKVNLTGFDEDDGSLQGVGTLDMADLACLSDPARAAAGKQCSRRMVPVKWTAKNSGAKR